MGGDCMLCKNNPNKTCVRGDHFDGAYADSQVLRAKCEAEIGVELYNRVTGQPASVSGVTVVVRRGSGRRSCRSGQGQQQGWRHHG
jgi:hypothetical protein